MSREVLTEKEKAAVQSREKMLVCRQVFMQEGLKGGLAYGAAGLLFCIFAPRLMSANAQRHFPMNFRVFITSGAFVAGFWIWGEPASNACARDPYKRDEAKVFAGQL